MSSRSPRASTSEPSSEEVAADFEDSLKDLQLNNRYEISNLTLIAKENTEHAEAISRALERHIKTTTPSRKLPALYVLDSIVKNVGTPYTTYLGRNLFSTFMDAYVLVDSATRRNMEGMLKTWKEPVPGSIDSRPVFPPENVRPIDNALLKAKTAAIQNQRQGQPSQVAFRGTSTPPQHIGQFLPPANPGVQPSYPGYAMPQIPPQVPQGAYGGPSQPPSVELESLKRDVSFLITRDRTASAMNPHDTGLRTRLQALLDLQNLMNIRTFNSDELHAVRAQVQQLAESGATVPQPAPPPPVQWTPPGAAGPYHNTQTPFPLPQYQQPPLHATPPVLNPETLSGLQALLANAPKPSTPQIRAALPNLRDAPHSQLASIQNHAASAAPSTNGAADLLSSLSKAGLIKLGGTPAPAPTTVPLAATSMQDQTALLLKSLQSTLAQPANGASPFLPATLPMAAASHVPISAASLKIFRPELVSSLYEAQPNQCSTCGRRFKTTENAREMKSRHLDWHFRTNQRIADPNLNRGHHRNWFSDELDWIKHVEFDPSTASAGAGEGEPRAAAKKGPQQLFVRAPPGMTKNTCNICFEDMKSSYSEDLQDWVFADAKVNNGKIVHALCLAELTKSHAGSASMAGAVQAANGARERSATPDSSLGKRKADGILTGGAGPRLKIG